MKVFKTRPLALAEAVGQDNDAGRLFEHVGTLWVVLNLEVTHNYSAFTKGISSCLEQMAELRPLYKKLGIRLDHVRPAKSSLSNWLKETKALEKQWIKDGSKVEDRQPKEVEITEEEEQAISEESELFWGDMITYSKAISAAINSPRSAAAQEFREYLTDSEYETLKTLLGSIAQNSRYLTAPVLKKLDAFVRSNYSSLKDLLCDVIDAEENEDFVAPQGYEEAVKLCRKVFSMVYPDRSPYEEWAIDCRDGILVPDNVTIPYLKDRRKLEAENPELFAEYTRCLRILNVTLAQSVASNILEMNDGAPCDMSKLLRWATSTDGLQPTINVFPYGFDGKFAVDDQGKAFNYYTRYGERLVKVPRLKVILNRNYTPGSGNQYGRYISTLSQGQSAQWLYTVEATTGKFQRRFGAVRKLLTEAPQYRQEWLKDLSSQNLKRQVLALMLETAWLVAPRTGDESNSSIDVNTKTRVKTFAMRTLELRHFSFNKSGALTISYQGKYAIHQTHIIRPTNATNRKLLSVYKGLIELHGGENAPPETRLFANIPSGGRNGTPLTIYFRDIKAYMKSVGFEDSTFSVFRKLKASVVAQNYLDDNYPSASTRGINVEKAIMEAATAAGVELGHYNASAKGKTATAINANTALENYILGDVIRDFCKRMGHEPSAALKKILTNTAVQEAEELLDTSTKPAIKPAP